MLKYILKNTISDYKNSYKSSFLSYSWVLIHPLLPLVIYSNDISENNKFAFTYKANVIGNKFLPFDPRDLNLRLFSVKVVD